MCRHNSKKKMFARFFIGTYFLCNIEKDTLAIIFIHLVYFIHYKIYRGRKYSWFKNQLYLYFHFTVFAWRKFVDIVFKSSTCMSYAFKCNFCAVYTKGLVCPRGIGAGFAEFQFNWQIKKINSKPQNFTNIRECWLISTVLCYVFASEKTYTSFLSKCFHLTIESVFLILYKLMGYIRPDCFKRVDFLSFLFMVQDFVICNIISRR